MSLIDKLDKFKEKKEKMNDKALSKDEVSKIFIENDWTWIKANIHEIYRIIDRGYSTIRNKKTGYKIDKDEWERIYRKFQEFDSKYKK